MAISSGRRFSHTGGTNHTQPSQQHKLPGSMESFKHMARGVMMTRQVPLALIPILGSEEQDTSDTALELHNKYSMLYDGIVGDAKLSPTERIEKIKLLLDDLNKNEVNVGDFLMEFSPVWRETRLGHTIRMLTDRKFAGLLRGYSEHRLQSKDCNSF